MPEQSPLTAVAESYLRALEQGDLDAVVALYAEDATVEDPVGGGTVLEGIAKITEFYATVTALDCSAELRETRVCGTEMLFHFVLTTKFDENTSSTIDVWDLMTFTGDGADGTTPKITSMKAYWGAENMS